MLRLLRSETYRLVRRWMPWVLLAMAVVFAFVLYELIWVTSNAQLTLLRSGTAPVTPKRALAGSADPIARRGDPGPPARAPERARRRLRHRARIDPDDRVLREPRRHRVGLGHVADAAGVGREPHGVPGFEVHHPDRLRARLHGRRCGGSDRRQLPRVDAGRTGYDWPRPRARGLGSRGAGSTASSVHGAVGAHRAVVPLRRRGASPPGSSSTSRRASRRACSSRSTRTSSRSLTSGSRGTSSRSRGWASACRPTASHCRHRRSQIRRRRRSCSLSGR